MESPQKLFPILDRFLLGGLGCGVFGICILLGASVYIWQNPPRPQPTSTPLGLGGFSTVTPASISTTSTPGVASSTPTSVLTVTPTQQGALPGTVIPSPVPQFDDSPPAGKIVFTCFIDQIDQ